MKTVKITAKTVDEAVAEGLRKLGATREEAVVRVIEEPTGGLFGLLRKKPAVVEISVPDLAAILVELFTDEGIGTMFY